MERAHKFLSGLKGFKRDVKRPKTIRVLRTTLNIKIGRQRPENWSPKVRQSINMITSRFSMPFVNEWWDEDPTCGRTSPARFTKTMRQSIPPSLRRRSLRNTASPCWTTRPTWPPIWLIFNFLRSNRSLRGQDLTVWKRW